MRAVTGEQRVVAGRYLLQDRLGRGAMGTVWRARDPVLARDVAVKEIQVRGMLTAQERAVLHERTLREARTAARLNHPGVVTVYDVVEADGNPWIVMELVEARSLEQVLAEDGPLPPWRAATVGSVVLGALSCAHAAGILHRDVKPSNVLLGAQGRVVLTDFGIATFAGDPGLTQAGMVMGTPGFCAPERIRGKPAMPASDLWSLGATLFAAVEGHGPFSGRATPMAVLAAVANEESPPARSAGPLAPLIAALLRRDPSQRPDVATAERLLAAVAAGGGGPRAASGHRAGGSARPPGGAAGQRPPAGPAPPGPARTAAASAGTADTAGLVHWAGATTQAGRYDGTAGIPIPGGRPGPFGAAGSGSPAGPGSGRSASPAGPAGPGRSAGPAGPGRSAGPAGPGRSAGPAGPGRSAGPAGPGRSAGAGGRGNPASGGPAGPESFASPGSPARYGSRARPGDAAGRAAPGAGLFAAPIAVRPGVPPREARPAGGPAGGLPARDAVPAPGAMPDPARPMPARPAASHRSLNQHARTSTAATRRRRTPPPWWALLAAAVTILAGTGLLIGLLISSPGHPRRPAARKQAAAAALPGGSRLLSVPAPAGSTAGFAMAIPGTWLVSPEGPVTTVAPPAGLVSLSVSMVPAPVATVPEQIRLLQRRVTVMRGGTAGATPRPAVGALHVAGARAASLLIRAGEPDEGQLVIEDVLFRLQTPAGPQAYRVEASAPAAAWPATRAVLTSALRTFRPV
jgi:eukaryotic-like serine/threonine-protein kinase